MAFNCFPNLSNGGGGCISEVGDSALYESNSSSYWDFWIFGLKSPPFNFLEDVESLESWWNLLEIWLVLKKKKKMECVKPERILSNIILTFSLG